MQVYFSKAKQICCRQRGDQKSLREAAPTRKQTTSVFLFSTLRACADDGIWREIRKRISIISFFLFHSCSTLPPPRAARRRRRPPRRHDRQRRGQTRQDAPRRPKSLRQLLRRRAGFSRQGSAVRPPVAEPRERWGHLGVQAVAEPATKSISKLLLIAATETCLTWETPVAPAAPGS